MKILKDTTSTHETRNVEDENALEFGFETDMPMHLRELSHAALLGDPNILGLTLASMNLWKIVTQLSIALAFSIIGLVLSSFWKGGNLEAKNEVGEVPLHNACAGGFVEIVQLLLDKAINSGCLKRMLDTVDAEGYTPLHRAAQREHVEVIRLLLDNGASPTKANTDGKIPQELARPESEAFRVFGEAE